MNDPKIPDFSYLDEMLMRAEATLGAAETHGLLCGVWCAAGRVDEGLWLGSVFMDVDPQNVAVQQSRGPLRALAAWTVEALNDPVLGMDLLLPGSESASLAERTLALAEWCQGYLLGLSAGGISQDMPLPDDVSELVRDFTEIARAGFDLDEADDEDEAAFMQIAEYVRIGVLLISEELQPSKQPPRLQ